MAGAPLSLTHIRRDTLVRRFPRMQLAGEPTLRTTFNLRGRETLPVLLT